jgi:hypothetical protein
LYQGSDILKVSDTAAVAASLLEENEGKLKHEHGDTEVYDCTHIGETTHKKLNRHPRFVHNMTYLFRTKWLYWYIGIRTIPFLDIYFWQPRHLPSSSFAVVKNRSK